MAGLRCRLGFHAWDYIFEKRSVAGFGDTYKAVGYYCVRCGVEVDIRK